MMEWDGHHIMGPKSAYKTKLEQEFRNLFVIRLPRPLHEHINTIGLLQFPPKPSHAFMTEIVREARAKGKA